MSRGVGKRRRKTVLEQQEKIFKINKSVGKSEQIHAEQSETRSLTYAIHQNKLKKDKRLKYKS